LFVHTPKVNRNERAKLLRVEITDEADPFFLFSLDITENDFHALKQDQSLLVEFGNFAPKFVELLECCIVASENENAPRFGVFLCTLISCLYSFQAVLQSGTGRDVSCLNIVEINRFKSLTHLSLRFRPGTDATIKTYLAARLLQVKGRNALLSQRITDFEILQSEHLETISCLKSDLRAALNNLSLAERNFQLKNSESLAEAKHASALDISEIEKRHSEEMRILQAHLKEQVV
jgi:spindle assembly abnormal protein 6